MRNPNPSLLPLTAAALMGLASTAESNVLWSNNFESYATDFELHFPSPATPPVEWRWAQGAGTEAGIGVNVVKDENTSTPFGSPNRYLRVNDTNSTQTTRLQSALQTGAPGVVTTFAFDFYEPSAVGTHALQVGYAITTGDLNATARLRLSLNNGAIAAGVGSFSSGEGVRSYDTNQAYRMWMIFNDSAAVANYDTRSIPAGSADIWIQKLVDGQPSEATLFVGNLLAANAAGASYTVGFRTFTTDVQEMWLDNAVLSTGVAFTPEPSTLVSYWDGSEISWANAAGWSTLSSAASPDPAGAPDAPITAVFGTSGLSGPQTVNLNGDQTALGLRFVSALDYTLLGGGSSSNLSLGGSGISVNANALAPTIGSPTAGEEVALTLAANQVWTNQSTTQPLVAHNTVAASSFALTLAGAGAFQINGNLTGTGTLKKLGTGSLRLLGEHEIGGTTVIDNGSVSVEGTRTIATNGWQVRGYGETGSTWATVGTTLSFAAGSSTAVNSGVTVRAGNNAAVGGFQQQLIEVSGAVTNDGALYLGRAGTLTVMDGGQWTQNGTASVVTQGGGSAALNILSGGSFTHAGPSFLLQSSGSLNKVTPLNIDGGIFTTTTAIHNGATVVVSGTSSAIVLTNGGTLRLSADTPDLMTTAGAPIEFKVDAAAGIVDTNGFSTTLNIPITGSGGLTKQGAGTFTTTAANAYLGNTTVTAGTLSLASAGLADDSSVTVAAGAVLNLAFSGTDTIDTLSLGGSGMAAGTYDAGTHPALISGTGQLIVQTSTATGGFAAWASGLGLSGSAEDDFDADGLPDAVEFVLGTDPKAASISGITAVHNGDDFIVTFSRDDRSETPDLALSVDVGGDLVNWPDTYLIGADNAGSSPGVDIAENTDAADTVTVTIPKNGSETLFARLRVVITES